MHARNQSKNIRFDVFEIITKLVVYDIVPNIRRILNIFKLININTVYNILIISLFVFYRQNVRTYKLDDDVHIKSE